MITISNYDQQKNSIDWKSMPKNIQDNRNDVESIMEFYNDDTDIKDTVDLFFKGINDNTKESKPVVDNKNTKNLIAYTKFKGDKNFGAMDMSNGTQVSNLMYATLIPIANKQKAIDVLKKILKEEQIEAVELRVAGTNNVVYSGKNEKTTIKPVPVKKAAPKKEKVKEVVNKKYVDNFTEEFKLIRRFWSIIEDVKITIEFRKAQLLYTAFNKAAVERKVRKESSAADIFTECNKKMKVLFEEFMLPTQSDVKVDFTDKALYEQIKDYVSNVKINPGVAVLKRYIAIQNTLPEVKKVQTLLKALEKVQANFKDNRLASEVDNAIKSLKNYLEKPAEPVEVINYALSRPRVCTNRIKCTGVDKNGKLHKGYKFQEHTGYVVKTKSKPTAARKTAVARKPKAVIKKKNLGLKKSLAGKSPKKAIQKKGLKNPIANVISNVVAAAILGEPEIAVAKTISSNPNVKKIGTANNTKNQFFTVAGEVGKFLQQVERKPVESVVITMDGQQGAGKTTTLYKFMDAFATPGNKCIFISGEEHPESHLAIDKANKLLSTNAKQNIDIIGDVKSLEDLYKTIAPYEIVFIDSWQKLQRMVGLIRLDEDLRKKFNGKVFVVIFQQTTTGRTKGGAEVVFDGDIIIKMVKEASFEDNYAYFDKNRYTLIPIENIRYNIANGVTYNPNAKEDQVINFQPMQNHQFNFRVF